MINRDIKVTSFAVIVLAVVLLMLFSMVPASDGEPGEGCGDGLTWTLEDGKLVISKTGEGTGRMTDFSYMGGDRPWQEQRLEIITITVGTGVTSVGEWAFAILPNLTAVELADSVETIGKSAFYGNSGLESVKMPVELTAVGDNAFFECKGLKSVTCHDKLATIGSNAFAKCIALETVDLGNSDVRIDSLAFSDDESLKSISLGKAVSIGEAAFINCVSLEGITIPDTVISIGQEAFLDNYSLKTLVLSNQLSTIEDSIFAGCIALESVTIPDSVESIGYDSFTGCTSLKTLNLGRGLITIGKEAFQDCSSLESLDLPDTMHYVYEYAFTECTSLKEVTVGKQILSLGYSSFYGCTELKTVTNKSMLNIEKGMEYHYVAYYADTVNGRVEMVSDGTFTIYRNDLSEYAVICAYEGTATDLDLSTVVYEGTTYKPLVIDNYAFKDTAVKNVTMGKDLIHIGSFAFAGTDLESVAFGAGLYFLWENAFDGYTFYVDDGEIAITPENLCGCSFGAGKEGSLYGCTVTLSLGEGSSESVGPDTGWTESDTVPTTWSKVLAKGQAIPEISNPVKYGYIFTGWSPAFPDVLESEGTFEAGWVASSGPDDDNTVLYISMVIVIVVGVVIAAIVIKRRA